jgi:hypothetical protein
MAVVVGEFAMPGIFPFKKACMMFATWFAEVP